MSSRPDELLQELALAAGLKPRWQDAHGNEQQVAPESLRRVLETMGLPCRSPDDCRASMARLESPEQPTTLLEIVRVGEPVMFRRQASLHYQLTLEDGTRIMGTARDHGAGKVAIPPIRKPGYHALSMGGLQCTIAAVPAQAPSVATLLNRSAADRSLTRPWVLGVQAYGLRRQIENSKPIERFIPNGWEAGGDFSLLGRLAREAGRHGAVGLAISPVHAMFSADAQRYSPYAPSSRIFLNAMLADPISVFGDEMLVTLAEGGEAAFVSGSGCLDWTSIQSVRLTQLRRLFDAFYAQGPAALLEDFRNFRKKGGEALNSHACYEALHAHFAPELGPGHGWQDWPSEYHNPSSLAVRHFCESHEQEVSFHAFLQWLAARSMAKAQTAARSVMPLGLIADMAVGTDPRGSHAWSRQQQVMTGVSVGAPPDIFQPEGQDWGLTAFSPWGLQQNGYAGFIETVRAGLAYAGGLRVDHVIGLERLWLVPQGMSAAEGVYLAYPKKELMGLLMLEAWRHGALVVGENLGTVPEGFDDDMARRGFLGMNVLWFEQEEGTPPRFRQPENWPRSSMAMLTTHDLPTARGWWKARDIDWRRRHGEFSAEQADDQRQMREQDKLGLWRALQQAGLVDPSESLPEEAPVKAMLAFLAHTPAALLHVSLEDLTGQEEQPNLPGAIPEDRSQAHPNWRRSVRYPVEDLLRMDAARELLAIFENVGEQRPNP